ncbi:hypothetical protein CEXT_144411 [Caerostris extrusa]|uniref:Uncharacterized protein n=1 Tax=Caerostris extrusa TaxID=172846 RepID=A0AAV4YAF5_CAEEX|nr:hypothetical protein CEXT_144411 [Caerostris extrusa]
MLILLRYICQRDSVSSVSYGRVNEIPPRLQAVFCGDRLHETVRWRTLILVNGCRVTAIRSSDERRNGHGLHFAQIKRPTSDMDLCADSPEVMGSHLIQRLYVPKFYDKF